MIISERDHDILIRQYQKKLSNRLWKYKNKLDERDYEELYADCLYAVSKAIMRHKEELGESVYTLIYKYVSSAIRRWFRNYYNNKQKLIRTSTHYLGEFIEDYGVQYSNDTRLSLTLCKDRGILSDRDWFILGQACKGYTNSEIGGKIGYPEVSIQRWRIKAVGKLKEVLSKKCI